MNKGLALLLMLFALIGCKRESDLPPLRPDEFTSQQRELLGQRLSNALFANPAAFPIRQQQTQQDSILNNYLQRLYDQASYFHHFDPLSTPENAWRPNRFWKIFLVDTEDSFAFTLPGGDHFISKGILQKLTGADQLFALLALETTRMQRRFLFYKFIERFNTNRVLEFIDRGETSNGTQGADLINEILVAEYDPEILQDLDASTLEHICQSSIFTPEALVNIDELFQQNCTDWVARKSYPNRANYIENIQETMISSCGNRGDQGDYQTFVLDNL